MDNDAEDVRVVARTIEGWSLYEMHVAVSPDEPGTGEWLEQRWQTPSGQAVPGRFPYHTDGGGHAEAAVTVPLQRIGAGAGSGERVVIAVHASVQRGSETEGAWAMGERFVEVGTWATFFRYEIQAVSQELTPGGTVTGVDGVRVSATAGALETPVELLIERSDDPPADALPEHYEAVGPVYRISAGGDRWAPGGTHFTLALPVPSGAAAADLRLAVLLPPGRVITDPSDPSRGPSWVSFSGHLVEGEGILVGTVAAVWTEGREYVLVAPNPPEGASGHGHSQPGAGGAENTGAVVATSSQGSIFDVSCHWTLAGTGACTPEVLEVTSHALAEAHEAYVQRLGFQEPLLSPVIFCTSYPDFCEFRGFEYELHVAGIEPCVTSDGLALNGVYIPETQTGITCIDPRVGDPRPRTTRHELFHAIQFGYETLAELYQSDANALSMTILEATASVAEFSMDGLRRSPVRQPLRVDRAVFFGDGQGRGFSQAMVFHRYLAQDFFVYLGRKLQGSGAEIDFLIPLFESGARASATSQTPFAAPTAIATVLGDGGTFPEIGDAYWGWAKNQAFENHQPLGLFEGTGSNGFGIGAVPADPGVTCTWLQHGEIHPRARIQFSPDFDEPDRVAMILPPFSSQVFEIFLDTTDEDYHVTIDVPLEDAPSLGLGYKFYGRDQAGTTDCWDSNRDHVGAGFSVPASGSGTTVYLLLSNMRSDQSLAMFVGLEYTIGG